MKVTRTALDGVLIIEPIVHGDPRGFFLESFNVARYASQAGIAGSFVQDNHSRSGRNVLRGLHLQVEQPQGKLVNVSRGEIWDVVVDIDPQSPTFKQHVSVRLSDDNHKQIYAPPGYAHGFCVLSEVADVQYKCTDYYRADDEAGIAWNDTQLAIPWPIDAPVLSGRDSGNAALETFLRSRGKA